MQNDNAKCPIDDGKTILCILCKNLGSCEKPKDQEAIDWKKDRMGCGE